MAALWRGARTGSSWAFFLASVSLGLGLDCFVAFRLFPIVPLVSGLALLFINRDKRRALITGGAVAGLGTLGPSGGESSLLANGLKTLAGLVVGGDQNWRQDLAGRPALDLAQDAFALAGIGGLTSRCRWPQAVTLLVRSLVGLSPSVVTAEAPHFGRTTMVTPAIAVGLGLGVAAAWSRSRRNRLLQTAIGLVGLFSMSLTARDCFGVWAHSGALFGAFGVEQVRIAQALRGASAGSTLYTANLPLNPWTIEYVMGPAAFNAIQLHNSANCLLLPAPSVEPAAYAVVNPQGAVLLPALRQAYPAATWIVNTWLDDQPYIGLLSIPGGQSPVAPVAVARSADFGGFVRMLGYAVTPAILQPGRTLKLRVLRQIERQIPGAYTTFIHLLGAPKSDRSIVYAQRDSQPCDDSYSTTGWAPGDLLAADMTLDLSGDLPAGTYTLQTGWYEAGTGARAPATGDAGPHLNDAAQLQQLKLSADTRP